MRRRNKVLAFVLAVLMVVGMLPLSVFAATGSAKSEENTQTREEWVKAQGGKLLFGSSFDDASKVDNAHKNSGGAVIGKINPAKDWSGSVIRSYMSNGDTKVWVDTAMGALRLQANGTAQDYWPQLNTTSTEGDTFTVEMSVRFNKHLTGTNQQILYNIDRSGDLRSDGGTVYYIKVDDTTWGLGFGSAAKDALATFKLGQLVKFSFTVDPVTGIVKLYVNGEYLGQGMHNINRQNYNHASEYANRKYPKFDTCRFLQITGNPQINIELHEMWVYSGTNIPYDARNTEENEQSIGQFVRANEGKFLQWWTFEDFSGKNTASYNSVENPNGLGYIYTLKSGTQYTYSIGTSGGIQFNTAKRGTMAAMRDENSDGYFVRMNTELQGQDIYFDLYPNKGTRDYSNMFVAGETWVVQADVRKSTHNKHAFTLFNIVYRHSSLGRQGMGDVVVEANGDIKVKGVVEGSDVVLGTVSSTEFTNVAFIVNTKNNTYSVAIDGVVVAKDKAYLDTADGKTLAAVFGGDSTKAFPNEIRTTFSGGTTSATDGYIDIDNYFVYSGNKINNENFYGYENAIEDGWVQTAQGYWRYYQDGKPLYGTQTIDGKKYYFGTDGYYSELKSDWLIDMNKANALSTGIGLTTEVSSSQWNYSMLMSDPAKEGGNAASNNLYNYEGYTIELHKDGAVSSAINTEYVRYLTENEKKYAYTEQTDTTQIPTYSYPVFDFKDAVAIEVDWYTDKPVNVNIVTILTTPYWGSGTPYPKYSRVPNMTLTSSDPIGWHTNYIDLTYNSRGKVDGGLTGNAVQAAIRSIQFSFTWDNANQNNNLNGANIYIGNINVVRAVAVKTDTCPADLGVVRTVDGATYIYKDNMSVPNVGWVDVDGVSYFAGDDGVAMTGVAAVAGQVYEFDDNGKLVGSADGIYTIDGKNYYYKNGVAQFGDFEYEGKTYTTKGNGEIVSMLGTIPSVNSGSYLKPDFSTVATENMIALATMEGKATTGEGSYFGSCGNNGLNSNVAEVGTITAHTKNTRFRFVDDNGNIVLKMRNDGNAQDPLTQWDSGANQNADIVFEASFKLGEDWNPAGMNALMMMRDGKNGNGAYSILANAAGYITMDGNIIGQLSATEYTRVAMVHKYTGTAQSSIEVFVNGVKVYTKTINNSKFISPSLFRMMHYQSGAVDPSTMYVDDIAIYKASTILSPSDAAVKNGLVNEGGFTRYYVNGIATKGIQTVEVEPGVFKQYVFDDTLAILRTDLTGFHSTGYYCVAGEVQEYSGRTNIDGTYYYFDANHKVVKNANPVINHLDPSQSFITDANGAITDFEVRGNFEVSTPADMYNGSPTWATQNGQGIIVNDVENNIAYFTNRYFRTTYNLFGDSVNAFSILEYDYIEIDVCVPEYFENVNGYFLLQYGGTGIGYDITSEATATASGSIYNFKGKTGWQTIRIPIASLSQGKLGNLTYINLVTNGWCLSDANSSQLNVHIDNSQQLFISEARLVKYSPLATGLNGWANNRYYEEGIMKTGWFDFEGTWYYLDPLSGYKTTGVAKVPAMPNAKAGGDYYYSFNEVGVCQGLADGLFTDAKYVIADGKASEVSILRIAEDGVLVDGIQTIGDNRYYVVPETLEVLTNTTLHVDTDGDGQADEIINTGADGVIAPAFDKWAVTDDGVYYYNASGVLASGYIYIAKDSNGNKGGYYYFDPETGKMLTNGWATVYGVNMFFGDNGKVADGVTVNTALSEADGYMDNTGYFVEGVPATTEITDGQYKYSFVDGKLVSKTLISVDAPEILVWVIKDGVKTSFYFSVGADGFTKKFDSYPCYTIEIYDASNAKPVKLEITDNTLVVAANSTSHTFEVRYVPVEHTYVENEALYQAPTCGNEGYKTFVCSLCGDSYKEAVEPTGEHTYGDWTVVLDPTCTHEGHKVAYCTGGCGTFKSENVDRDPDNHRFVEGGEFYSYKAPTCTVDGYASGVCEWCGERQDVTVIPATGHNMLGVDNWITDVPATCVSKGTEKGTCPDCGASVTRETAINPNFHLHGNSDGIIVDESEAGDFFALFKVVVPSTCATQGYGIFRCLDCGGFIGDENSDFLVALNLDPDNHEFQAEYLVILDADGNVIETVTGASREEMLAKSKFLCGYSGEWRRDCYTESCKAEDGSYYYEVFGTVNGSGAHNIDLSKLVTTNVTTDALYGMHYYVCQNCDKAIQAAAHVMSDIRVSEDGLTHIIYCKDGCIIAETNEPYSVTEDCEFVLSQIKDGDVVVGHAMQCKCGYIVEGTYVDHEDVLKDTYDATHHWSYCEDCGYVSAKVAHTIVTVPAQTATCWQIGWDEYDTCDCGYVEDHKVYNQHPHSIPENAYASDATGHWFACQNDGCTYKHLFEQHTMVHIDAYENTCTTDGAIDHDECAVCGWFDADVYPDGVVIPMKGHHPAGEFNYNTTEHWQFCDNVNNGQVCGAIIRAEHTYTMDTDHFFDYDDEEGTANHKCDTCAYKKPLTGLDTWWGVLGLTREGTAGNYSYYLLKADQSKYTDYLALLPDGSYRYFGADGKLVMSTFNNGNFDNITGFGSAQNLITYPAYNDNKAAQRGAIANAIIDTVDGIMMVKNGDLALGWTTITIGSENRDYFFNTVLGSTLVNTTLREGVLVKSTATSGDLTINALNVTNDAIILVNVRDDGSRKLGVIMEGGKPYLYLDGTAGKMPSGWVADTYTTQGETKVYFVFTDKTLAYGNYVVTPGGVYWNFAALDAENPCVRADEHCRNEIATDGTYINAEGKAAKNELVTLTATGKTYFIVMGEDNTQSIYKEKAFVLADGFYYVVDTANGEVSTFYTGWVDEDSYSLNGVLQVSTFCVIEEDSYYFDGAGNKIVSDIVYINSKVEGESGFAWQFDADGVATRVNNQWVKFIGEDGLVIADEKGYYFDTQKGLAYGLQDGSIVTGDIYIFDDNGYLIVNVAEHDYKGVIYVIDADGKAKVKEEE